MGSLYRKDLDKYKKYFNNAAKLHGIEIEYRYIIKRNSENQSGENVYSELSQPIKQNVIIEQGIPMVDSLKQLGWFVDSNTDLLLVDFSVNTPNLQEGCRIKIVANEQTEQNKEYSIIKLSNTTLYPTCIKCLCQPILENESIYHKDGNITYGQQDILSDEENNTFISEPSKISFF